MTSKVFRYGMKAAPIYSEQLRDRVSKFKKLSMNPIIELHLFGSKDVFNHATLHKCIDNCLRFDSEFYVHFPVQDPDTYGIYDPAVHPDVYFEAVLDFSNKINAKAIILHRVYGIGTKVKRSTATSHFNKKILQWAKIAEPLHIYVENYSFIWLPKTFSQPFVVSPLDHFFPWDMKEFMEFIDSHKVRNVSVVLDIAHAAISSNMFNILKRDSKYAKDSRFVNIIQEDLLQSTSLTPMDFMVNGAVHYFHVSDSFLLNKSGSLNDLDKYLMAEGLPLGRGNLDLKSTIERIHRDSVLIMEIISPDGRNDGTYQSEGIKYIRDIIN